MGLMTKRALTVAVILSINFYFHWLFLLFNMILNLFTCFAEEELAFLKLKIIIITDFKR